MFILIGNGFHFNRILGHVMIRTFPPGELMLPLPNLKQTLVYPVVLTPLQNPWIMSAEGAENAITYSFHICSQTITFAPNTEGF
jgi:hypothetical protein